MITPKISKLNYYFIREKLQAQLITTIHVSSKDQLADIFTKPLYPQVATLCNRFGAYDIHPPT